MSKVMVDIGDGIIIIICTYHPDLLFPDPCPDPFPDLFPRLLHLTDVTGVTIKFILIHFIQFVKLETCDQIIY